MDAWIDGWMDACMHGWIYELVDRRMGGCIEAGCLNPRMFGSQDELVSELM